MTMPSPYPPTLTEVRTKAAEWGNLTFGSLTATASDVTTFARHGLNDPRHRRFIVFYRSVTSTADESLTPGGMTEVAIVETAEGWCAAYFDWNGEDFDVEPFDSLEEARAYLDREDRALYRCGDAPLLEGPYPDHVELPWRV